MVMLNVIGSPSHQSPPFNKTPSEGPGAIAPELGLFGRGRGMGLVQSDPAGAGDESHSLMPQERGESGRDWIELQETGSNSRKRHRLSDFSITQLLLSFSPGNATLQKKEEPFLKYQEWEVGRTIR